MGSGGSKLTKQQSRQQPGERRSVSIGATSVSMTLLLLLIY